MGGFKIEIDDVRFSPLLAHGPILTPSGVHLMARKSLKDLIGHKETIKDKSKADYLAKSLFCAQAVWFVVQIFARIGAGLPITLLELNTSAHVACSILLWQIWWYKPKDVNEPLSIKVDKFKAAILSEDPRFQRLRDLRLSNPTEAGEGAEDSLIAATHNEYHDIEAFQNDDRYQKPKWQAYIPKQTHGAKIRPCGEIRSWEQLPGYKKIKYIQNADRADGVAMLLPGQEMLGFCWTQSRPIHLNEQMVNKLELLNEIEEQDEYQMERAGWKIENQTFYLTRKVPNVPDHLEKTKISMLPFYGLSILGLFYGGIHFFSWNAHFPSALERLLWRVASCVVAAGGFVVWGFLELSLFGCKKFNDATVWKNLMSLLIGLAAIGIVLMRIYLVVEAFISVRSLPIGSYETPMWVGLLPHVG